jgi:hypothetical protein
MSWLMRLSLATKFDLKPMKPQNLIPIIALVTACAGAVASAAAPAVKWHPGHYIFVGHGEIRPEHILEHFRGVEKCYAWSKLEPAQGRYDFTSIRQDLDLLKKNGKQLGVGVKP